MRGLDIERIQKPMVSSSVMLSMWQLVQTGGLADDVFVIISPPPKTTG